MDCTRNDEEAQRDVERETTFSLLLSVEFFFSFFFALVVCSSGFPPDHEIGECASLNERVKKKTNPDDFYIFHPCLSRETPISFYRHTQSSTSSKIAEQKYFVNPQFRPASFKILLLLLLFSNHRRQIDLKKQTDEGDVSNYQTNGEFDLVDFEAIHHEEYYSCCPEPYPDITYVIKMKRRPLFYVFNLILPCLLINGIG